MLEYDIVIIGGGPAGLSSAIEAKKNGIDNILVIERDKELGGILNQCIHNGFGIQIYKEDLTGPEYANRLAEELQYLGIETKIDTMVIDISKEKIITAINSKDGIMIIKAKAIILAMGCRERTRGNINISGFRPVGIYTAGMAQRLINIEGYNVGKKVIILGSGDIGMIMARRLTLEGSQVVAVLSRGNYPTGLKRNVIQCLEDYNIPLMLNHNITRINGKDRVKSVIVAKTDENKNIILGYEKEYECDTVLLSVGLIPENELSTKAEINLDKNTGGPFVDDNMETNVDGIFACGNVLQVHDIVDNVTYESRKAGKNAAKYIKNRLTVTGEYIQTVPGEGIKYIVPQRIEKNNEKDSIELFFRVHDNYKDVNIEIIIDNKVYKKTKKKYLFPGEMEKLIINPRLIGIKNISSLEIRIVKE